MYLTELDHLANLDIGNNKNISDKSLSCLSELKGLRILSASPLNGITDEGLKHLSKIENLRWLRLSGDKITDAGLMHLASLKNREILTLSRNNSEEIIENLKKGDAQLHYSAIVDSPSMRNSIAFHRAGPCFSFYRCPEI